MSDESSMMLGRSDANYVSTIQVNLVGILGSGVYKSRKVEEEGTR